MDATRDGLTRAAASRLLGWLNLSDGRPDPKWQRQLDDAFVGVGELPALRHWLAGEVDDAFVGGGEWLELRRWLVGELDARADPAAFHGPRRAGPGLALVLAHALPPYRRHHARL